MVGLVAWAILVRVPVLPCPDLSSVVAAVAEVQTVSLPSKVNNVAFTPKLNRWYHVVGTADGVEVRIYIDGVAQGTATPYTGVIDKDTEPVWIGTDSTGGIHGPFNGSIDDVRVYNRALSATEITQLYNLGR